MRRKFIVLYALFALLALGLLLLSLNRYRFYQKYIDISMPASGFSKHYDNPHTRAPSVHTHSDTVQRIDINSADIDLLTHLPGIGRETALHIIEYRNKNGDFANVDDLIGVSGIGEKKLEKLRDYVIIR